MHKALFVVFKNELSDPAPRKQLPPRALNPAERTAVAGGPEAGSGGGSGGGHNEIVLVSVRAPCARFIHLSSPPSVVIPRLDPGIQKQGTDGLEPAITAQQKKPVRHCVPTGFSRGRV